MKLESGNLLANLPARQSEEHLDALVASGGVTIERIVSQGHASPEGFWYDQPRDEWVVLISGEALLRFEGEAPRRLVPGDWVLIPAHAKHRVDWTLETGPTIWLAVHFGGLESRL